MRIPLIRPYLPEGTAELVAKVLDSGLFVEGPLTAEFEAMAAGFLGVPHCIAVDSATTGLEMAVRCLDIGPGDEVIVPDYTFPATALAVMCTGATPVLVDVDPDGMNMDMDAFAQAITPATRAVMPVSTFGNPLDYDRLLPLARERGILVIEDAACAFGAEYDGLPVGSHADMTVFSLHPRKSITTARGGLVTTGNDQWAHWLRSYKCFGKGAQATRAETTFDQPGRNAMLPDVLSAIGLPQLKMVGDILKRRRELARRYDTLLDGVEGIRRPSCTTKGLHAYQTYCVFVEQRDRVLSEMRAQGIEAQIGTYSLHKHSVFSRNSNVRIAGAMHHSRWVFDHALALPLYHEMTAAEQDEVVNTLQKYA